MPDGRPATWHDLIAAEAKAAGVPEALALSVAEQESQFNPAAKGSSGELGLMQLMPETARGLGVDPADPVQNIRGGIKYLKQQIDANNGDVSKALSAYNGGPRGSNRPEYVAGVLGRLSKYAQVGGSPAPSAAPASSAAPPEAPPRPSFMQDLISSLDPRTRAGRRNLTGMAGATAAGALTGGVGLVGGASAILGAGLAGAGEEAGEEVAHGESISPRSIAGAGGEQAAYEGLGQFVSWPLKAVGRRVAATKVGHYAREGLSSLRERTMARLESGLSLAEDTLRTTRQRGTRAVDAVRSRLNMAAPPITAREAGTLTNDVIQGPAKSALDDLGKAVEDAAQTGPEVPVAPLKDRLAELAEQITPMASHPQLPSMPGYTPAQVAMVAQRNPSILALPAEHPLPGRLAFLREALEGVDSIPFEDAHKFKRMLDEAVNWESPARKQVGQITKATRNTLRDLMRGHAPYDQATQAYAEVLPLFRKGIAKDLQRTALENPERLIKLVKGDEPTKLKMLQQLLLHEAGQGGGQAEGEAAWNAMRAAWTHEHLIKSGTDKILDKITNLDPDFVKTMYGDPQGSIVLQNLKQIGQAFKDAVAQRTTEVGQAKEVVVGAREAVKAGRRSTPTERAFRQSTVNRSEQSTTVVADVLRTIFAPFSSYGLTSQSRLYLQGPKIADLIQWASYSPAMTRLLVKATTSPVAGMALADAARAAGLIDPDATAALFGSGGPPKPAVSHAVSEPPPRPSVSH